MKYTPSTFWTALLLVIAVCALWYSSKATWALYSYYRTTEQVEVTVKDWTPVTSGRSQTLQAQYSYEYDGVLYEGSSILKDERFRNPWSAQERIKKLETETIKVWVDPSSPGYSQLVREFPYVTCAYAVALIGLFLYFFWLKRYCESLGR